MKTSSVQLRCVPWLKGCQRRTYSQFGEDGLIAEALEHVGANGRACFEVGASDGTTFSNVRALIEIGWSACLIEHDAELHKQLVTLYGDNPRVSLSREWVLPWTIDDILDSAGLPEDLDLGVIDIDEQDFWLWAGMRRRPALMLVEFAVGRSPWQLPRLRDDTAMPNPDKQAGAERILELGRARGYVPIAQTLCNLLFVRRELLYAD